MHRLDRAWKWGGKVEIWSGPHLYAGVGWRLVASGMGNEIMDTVLMEEMTWPEIQAALGQGSRTALVVSASVEQHGPHLPLITDTVLGYEVAVRVARKLGDALVAPVLRPACSDHHMDFPGSLTVPEELFHENLRQYCLSLAHHGFQEILLLSSHGGNFLPIQRVARRLVDELAARNVQVRPIVDVEGFMAAQTAVLKDLGRSGDGGPHADLTETSQMLLILPHLVRQDRIEKGFTGDVPLQDVVAKGLRHFTSNGIMGDPEGSTAELGERVFEAVSDYIVGEVDLERAQDA